MGRTSGEWELGYRPALDGLRGLAVVAVVLHHIALPEWHLTGSRGVDVFFMLSGFLITSLLLEERHRHTTVNLRRFYLRRFWRLAPALGVLLAAAVVLLPLLDPAAQQQTALGVVLAGLYITNWVRLAGVATPDSLVGHTWSLAIEEQFYTVFPWLFVRTKPRTLMVAAAVLAAVAAAWQTTAPYELSYFSTFGRFDELASGVALAAFAHLHPGRFLQAAQTFRRFAPAALAALAATMLSPIGTDLWQGIVVNTAVLGAGLLLVTTAAAGTAPAVLATRPAVHLGKLSYSLYLWHQIPSKLMQEWSVPDPAGTVITVVASVLLAEASWRLVEEPLRRRASRRKTAKVRSWRPSATYVPPST